MILIDLFEMAKLASLPSPVQHMYVHNLLHVIYIVIIKHVDSLQETGSLNTVSTLFQFAVRKFLSFHLNK